MKTNYFQTIIFFAVTLIFASGAAAQDSKQPTASPADVQRPAMRSPNDPHLEMLRNLGLTDEQVQQIKKIHMDQRPLMDQAQKRLREANRSLNDAIYADQVNEADFQARLSEFQIARGEVERTRYLTELSVRRILTQEQLIKFREMRETFEQMRKNQEMRRNDRQLNRQRRGSDPNRSPDAQSNNFRDHHTPVI